MGDDVSPLVVAMMGKRCEVMQLFHDDFRTSTISILIRGTELVGNDDVEHIWDQFGVTLSDDPFLFFTMSSARHNAVATSTCFFTCWFSHRPKTPL